MAGAYRRRDIKNILDEAAQAGDAEDEQYGDNRDDELPEGLHSKQKLKEKIKRALEQMNRDKDRINLTDNEMNRSLNKINAKYILGQPLFTNHI
jgi:predicted transcriptional regulator